MINMVILIILIVLYVKILMVYVYYVWWRYYGLEIGEILLFNCCKNEDISYDKFFDYGLLLNEFRFIDVVVFYLIF